MGHILFGLPEIRHFHLHSRVGRKLTGRGHRVTALHGDPISFNFFAHQGIACIDWKPQRPARDHLVPVEEFAAIDCRICGVVAPGNGQLRRAARQLERRITGLLRLFEHDRPDLVLLYEGRSGLHRMLHFVARKHGVPVLHVGPGMLPMTLQVDRGGIDGDGSWIRLTERDYRQVTIDDEFLAAATAAWLGRAYPPPLARLGVAVPSLRTRLGAMAVALLRRQWRAGILGLTAWDQAYRLRWPRSNPPADLPAAPFVAVLLQDRGDPRLRLDAPDGPSQEQLIRTTWRAVQQLDSDAAVVVVMPTDGRPPRRLVERFANQVKFLPDSAGAMVVATAMAIVTVNHPLGLAGILIDTPVIHTGRSPYGIPGVAVRTDGAHLAEHMLTALQSERPALRRRFLTRVLKDNHIWCPAAYPDSNGVAGLVRRIENAIGSTGPRSRPLRYRPGPVWPLATGSDRSKRKPRPE